MLRGDNDRDSSFFEGFACFVEVQVAVSCELVVEVGLFFDTLGLRVNCLTHKIVD